MRSYIRAIIHVYREIKIQKQYNKEFLIPYLKELEDKYNGNFSAAQTEKILKYYGLFITSFLCSSYKRLQGKNLNEAERKRATLFGILTPVGDDLFDIDKLNIENIRTITYNPDVFIANSFSAHVAKEIQSYLLKHVPDQQEYLQASKNVLEIQVETIQQTHPSISKETLEAITYSKGAYSVIIYHQALDTIADAQMKEVLYLIGSLFQLGNDIFDLYKDVKDNIYTLVNTCDDFSLFSIDFKERIRSMNKAIYALPYSAKDKKEFSIIMNTINARSMVALEQFERLQKKTGNKIEWWNRSRKDMICDMEKPANVLRWFYYICTLPGLK